MNTQILKMTNISKSFPGVRALNDVHFDLNEGEIHALVGENGAGKSTLMKILTGIYTRDQGDIFYMGSPLHLSNTREAQEKGICMIHQELNMMNHLTVAQNMFIGREKTHGFFLDDRALNKQTEKILQSLGIEINPSELLGNLTVGKQQMVEIGKAISYHSKILVLDEPTAALTDTEIDHLFTVMRDLKAKGVGMIYISHRMDEIERITDRVTVLRDGEYVGTLLTKESTHDQIVKMMVGRIIFDQPKIQSNCPPNAPLVLEVEHLNAGRMVQDVSFNIKKGEILCFAGLMGAGRTEVARAVFGADPKTTGSIKVNGRPVIINQPRDAVNAGIGYLSEDRKQYGLALGLSVAENSVLANYNAYAGRLFVHQSEVNQTAQLYVNKLNTRTPSIKQLVRNLSGGNQQKVVIAKWLIRNSEVLIFDEPTRGIDVGAKSEIYKLIHELADEGKAILVISSELPEVLRLADRIVVMCEGHVTGELGAGSSQEAIMGLAHKHR
ncbi:MAG: sugar ABC transporter ATP-binding protein [Clostridiaceae bacterium]|nr:sugar ABC transporter ATP-binding protein [Clostridiaceae bacterium]